MQREQLAWTYPGSDESIFVGDDVRVGNGTARWRVRWISKDAHGTVKVAVESDRLGVRWVPLYRVRLFS